MDLPNQTHGDKTMSALSIIENKALTAAEAFATPDSLTALINGIRAEVETEAPDLSTAASRQRIASLAYKVARSKTALDELGKQLVSEWKTKSAAVDKERKRVRDELDALRDQVRKPLTDWEAEQERTAAEAARIEAERIAAEKAEAERIEAERQDVIRKQLEEIAARESAVKAEEERIAREAAAKIAAERAEAERIEREARIAAEAAEKAKRDAELEIIRANQRAEQAKRDAELAVQRERERAESAAKAKAEADAKAKADAERKAAVAPDKEKITAYAAAVRAAIENTPDLATDARQWMAVAVSKLLAIVDRIDEKAGEM